ncbi:conserved hypothetical protein [Perkinsus marinus ATCC 50983]|uniref:GST N-terminal domain-containing protein n=1 Tax=Perkinsus marinus (strain ATCC 50983 / TXsc) TaxID=423536 RepID=C5KFU3_PERM5|nr:conserved hypothetical protein [Perkinsus marinus ATCC 50983]EER16645.1 conserved hypothetical protein [Perkinsus marinus ATCC 50983]|eukprot:XP_002784849.1 conserved hypothetical protein [Perkinsus marinus ATCC 50983]
MSTKPPFTLYGSNASPYSCKIRAFLRYRRIHFKWAALNPMEISTHVNPSIRKLRTKLIPILEWPDGRVLDDSTVIIDVLEEEFPIGRNVLPPSGPERFLVKLLEDFFDEWFMKATFNTRWSSEADRDWASRWIIADQVMSSPKLFNLPDPSQREALTKFFRDRQVGRLRLVGCEDDKLWQYVMHQVVGALDAHLRDDNAFRFLLGPRPTAADFALYGLLKQLSLDHTTGYIIRDRFTAALLDLAATKKNSGVVTIDNLLGEDTSRTIIMMKTVNEDSVMKALTQLVEELNIPKPSMFYTPTNHSAVHFESSGVGFCTECLKKKVAIMEIPCGKEYGGKAYMCEECYSKRDDAGPVFKIEY